MKPVKIVDCAGLTAQVVERFARHGYEASPADFKMPREAMRWLTWGGFAVVYIEPDTMGYHLTVLICAEHKYLHKTVRGWTWSTSRDNVAGLSVYLVDELLAGRIPVENTTGPPPRYN